MQLIGIFFFLFFFLQTLKSQVTKLSIGDCAGGHRSENRSKSRDIMLLPRKCPIKLPACRIVSNNLIRGNKCWDSGVEDVFMGILHRNMLIIYQMRVHYNGHLFKTIKYVTSIPGRLNSLASYLFNYQLIKFKVDLNGINHDVLAVK